jgi:hypothetical protein
MATKIGPKNSSSPRRYFTEHIADVFGKPPCESDENYEKLELFDPVAQEWTDINLQQSTSNRERNRRTATLKLAGDDVDARKTSGGSPARESVLGRGTETPSEKTRTRSEDLSGSRRRRNICWDRAARDRCVFLEAETEDPWEATKNNRTPLTSKKIWEENPKRNLACKLALGAQQQNQRTRHRPERVKPAAKKIQSALWNSWKERTFLRELLQLARCEINRWGKRLRHGPVKWRPHNRAEIRRPKRNTGVEDQNPK